MLAYAGYRAGTWQMLAAAAAAAMACNYTSCVGQEEA